MVKKYAYIIILFFFFFSFESFSQESKGATSKLETGIEGLSIYPNPTSTGKIFITSKASLDKKIEIYDVLGKKLIDTLLTGKELNISALPNGVYILKIKEDQNTATRKLIIN